jgi:hypothetical protein
MASKEVPSSKKATVAKITVAFPSARKLDPLFETP